MPQRATHAVLRRVLANVALVAAALATLSLGGAAAAGGDVLLIGSQDVAGATDAETPGVAEAFRTTASTSGQVTSLQVYVAPPTAAASFSAGIYTDASGHPGQLLGQGSGAASGGSWSAVQLGSAVAVTAGTTYWIAVLGSSGDRKLAVRDVNHGGASEASAQSALTSLPGSWSTGATSAAGPLSAFGAGIPAPTSTASSSTSSPSDTTPPSTPTNLAVSAATQTNVTLSWSASSDNVAVAGYDVYVDGMAVGQTSSTNFGVSGLTCATTHTFAVDAYDAAGNHSSKASVNASTAPCVTDTQAPSTPTGLTTTGTTTSSVSLAWTASTDNVGVAGYDVYQDSVLVGKTSSTSYTASGLGCGISHVFSVDAFDAAGNHSGKVSVSGSTSACTDTQAPTAPTGLVSTGATATTISLSWSPSTDNVGVAGYDVYQGSQLIDSFDATSYTVGGPLTCGTNYSLAVDAFDAAGNHSTKTTLMASTAACSASVDPSGQPMPVGDITGWHQIYADNFSTESVPLGTTCGDPNGFPHTLTNWSAYPYPWKGTPTWGTYCPERTTSIHNGMMDIWLHSESVSGTMLHLIDAPMPKIAGYTDTNGQLYGRYVIRYEEPSAFNMFHASWLLWPNSGVWPGDGEIDFPEGDTNNTAWAFMHWQNATSGSQQDAYSTGVPMYGAWHTAVIEWLPSRVTFILDGKVVGNSTDTSKIPSTPMHFVIQNGGSFSVSTPDNTTQGHIYIDWITIYKPA